MPAVLLAAALVLAGCSVDAEETPAEPAPRVQRSSPACPYLTDRAVSEALGLAMRASRAAPGGCEFAAAETSATTSGESGPPSVVLDVTPMQVDLAAVSEQARLDCAGRVTPVQVPGAAAPGFVCEQGGATGYGFRDASQVTLTVRTPGASGAEVVAALLPQVTLR